MRTIRTMRPEFMMVIGVIFAFTYWLVDSVIDTLVFNQSNLFIENLLTPGSHELWSRLQVIFLLLIFSLLAMFILKWQVRITSQVTKYKDRLEQTVNERTNELTEKNHQLELEIEEKQKIERRLEHLAMVDPLTNIYNRRKFNEVLSYELRRDSRYSCKMSLLLCDIDGFKRINDEYGHPVGDNILKMFADKIRSIVRNSDTFARWGGEEFVVLLPETGFETAIQIAESIRLALEMSHFPVVGKITASFGVTQCMEGDTEDTLFNRVDEALYKAKGNGRNRTEVNPPLHVLLNALSGV